LRRESPATPSDDSHEADPAAGKFGQIDQLTANVAAQNQKSAIFVLNVRRYCKPTNVTIMLPLEVKIRPSDANLRQITLIMALYAAIMSVITKPYLIILLQFDDNNCSRSTNNCFKTSLPNSQK
jgi:hypothetical protein